MEYKFDLLAQSLNYLVLKCRLVMYIHYINNQSNILFVMAE
jgi:hypothetical protein